MKPLWKKVLGAVLGVREYIAPKCPICQAPMYLVPGTKNRMCENGHFIGPDMKRVDLINDGEFRGEL